MVPKKSFLLFLTYQSSLVGWQVAQGTLLGILSGLHQFPTHHVLILQINVHLPPLLNLSSTLGTAAVIHILECLVRNENASHALGAKLTPLSVALGQKRGLLGTFSGCSFSPLGTI